VSRRGSPAPSGDGTTIRLPAALASSSDLNVIFRFVGSGGNGTCWSRSVSVCVWHRAPRRGSWSVVGLVVVVVGAPGKLAGSFGSVACSIS
jgi:hypothetical protein